MSGETHKRQQRFQLIQAQLSDSLVGAVSRAEGGQTFQIAVKMYSFRPPIYFVGEQRIEHVGIQWPHQPPDIFHLGSRVTLIHITGLTGSAAINAMCTVSTGVYKAYYLIHFVGDVG